MKKRMKVVHRSKRRVINSLAEAAAVTKGLKPHELKTGVYIVDAEIDPIVGLKITKVREKRSVEALRVVAARRTKRPTRKAPRR
jgi:hypothetical protein